MGAVVVLGQELVQQGSEFLVLLPGFVPEPLLERTRPDSLVEVKV
jgi:hypothetical protein